MEKSIKIILFLLVGLVVISCATTLLNNSSIRDLRTNLKNAQASTDAAISELKASQLKLDSIKADMKNFSAYISNIHKAVEIDELDKQIEEEKSKKVIISLNSKRDSLERLRDQEALALEPIRVRR